MSQTQEQKLEKMLKEDPNRLDNALQITELQQKESGLSTFLVNNADGLWKLAADIIRMSDKERYLTRLALAIANNEKLAPCFETLKGKMSIIQAMQKCVELGLIPDDEAYLIPYGQDRQKINGKWQYTWYSAELQPKAEGYMKIVLSEPNPMFAQIKYDLVYENDHIIIDSSQGIIDHKIKPTKDGRGEIIGAWVQFVPVDDNKTPIAKYWDKQTIENVRDKHSPSWKQYLENERLYNDCIEGNIKGAQKQPNGNYKIPKTGYEKYDKYVKSPENLDNNWATDKPQMMIKTIIKSECRKWASIKPGLKPVIESLENNMMGRDKLLLEEPDREDQPGILGKADRVFDQFDSSGLTDEQKKEIEKEEAQEAKQDSFFDKVVVNELND